MEKAVVYVADGKVFEVNEYTGKSDDCGMLELTYEEFIFKKMSYGEDRGFSVDNLIPTSIPMFDWQEVVTRWALRRGVGSLFEDCGLGKTFQFIRWAHEVVRYTNEPVMIWSPLGVSYQTVAEGEKFGLPVRLVKSKFGITEPAVYISNYERLHLFDHDVFGGVVLDESSILKDIGSKTRQILTHEYRNTRFKLSCTATPDPNSLNEIGNQAEFLGIMKRSEMESTYFINDQKVGKKEGSSSKWRIKKHAEQNFYDWLASWSVYIRTPYDLGFDGSKYVMPEHHISKHLVEHDFKKEGYLIRTAARTFGEVKSVLRNSIEERLEVLHELICGDSVCNESDMSLIWCALNLESKLISKELNIPEITGSQSTDEKEEKLLAFCRGEIKSIVTKPKIAGHGLNFQKCNHNYWFGMDKASFEQWYQGVRRFLRFGQVNDVYTRIIQPDAAEWVIDLVMEKERNARKTADEVGKRMEKAMQEEVLEKKKRNVEVVKIKKRDEGDGWVSYHGDCVFVAQSLPDDSVDYSIFSVPFPEIFTYSDSPQDMGNNMYEEFLDHFEFHVPEMYRTTLPGRLCSIHCMPIPILKMNEGYRGLRDFPGDLIKTMQRHGWIWFSDKAIWKDPVVENARNHSLGHGNYLKDSSKLGFGIYERVVTFLKPGDNADPISHKKLDFPVARWQKEASGCMSDSLLSEDLTPDDVNKLKHPEPWMLAPIWYDIRPGDTLQKESARDERDEKHICPLQLLLTERFIKMYSNPNDLVATWYGGIGSEGFVAVKNERRALLVELKDSYYKQLVGNMRQAEQFKNQLSLPGF